MREINLKTVNINLRSLKRRVIEGLPALAFLILLASCGNSKRATYFHKTSDSDFRLIEEENLGPVLQPNDLLSISVSSVNPEAAVIFNTTNVYATQSSTASGNIARVSGYLVDLEGNIKFPILGTIAAAGKTKKMLTEEITSELEIRQLLIDPIVDIRYLNFKVSVLGEVKDPTVLTVPSEKISILEALGLAGDITIYGNKKNVALIREQEGGSKKLVRLDLTSTDILRSPYYHLKSNDIIYVEPIKAKVASTSQVVLWLPVILSATSLVIIALNR